MASATKPRAKVWPLRTGVKGFSAQGFPITLQPGTPGWMDMDKALVEEGLGNVQVMAGKTPQHLGKPTSQPRNTGMPMEEPQVDELRADPAPAGEADANLQVDEEDASPVEKQAALGRKKVVPKKGRTYKRRDLKAED